MTVTTLLTDSKVFNEHFDRCCGEYESVDVAVAWCGNPKHTLPYKRLERFGSSLRATVGVSFEQTHPDGIQWLINIKSELRIFRNDKANLFHPKIYLFKKGKLFALFLGSSNLTYSGFHRNVEANVLIEGKIGNENVGLVDLQLMLEKWRSDTCSFAPTDKWIANYTKAFFTTKRKAHGSGIKTPQTDEDDISTANWLSDADWNIYQGEIRDGLASTGRSVNTYLDLLNEFNATLPLPWDVKIFDEINNRRLIGGMEPYGWLGHVAAAGNVRRIMTNPEHASTRKTISDVINKIGQLTVPIDWDELEIQLERLVALGHTMKVWSRILCLVKPDIYCTVASPPVRLNLSKALGVSQKSIETPSGYISILKMIHSSPWYNSNRPRDPEQRKLWDHRVALMDAIFYV
jgi:hypothetical protein